MNALIMVALGVVSCPWGRSHCVTYCEPAVICLPCAPVVWVEVETRIVEESAPAEVGEDPIENAVSEVAESTAVEDGLVTELLVDQEIVTEPAGLTFPSSFSLDGLALDWGVATIGSGTLFPTTSTSFSGLGGIIGSRGSAGDSAAILVPAGNGNLTQIITNIVNDIGASPAPIVNVTLQTPTPDPSPVPEPLSLAVWLLALCVAAWRWRLARAGATPPEGGVPAGPFAHSQLDG